MKITDVKVYLVFGGRQNLTFVKVETDTELYGWGEASVEGQEKSVEECVKLLAARSVIGENPENIEKIWQKMYRHGFWKGGFVHMSAISGIDQALWDLLGKMYKVPTYKLLGGAVRDKVFTYTHAFNAETAVRAVENGFAGVKVGGGAGREFFDPYNAAANLEQLLSSMRDAIGYDKIVCIDNHGQCPPSVAMQQLAVAGKYKAYFFEEPVPPENSAAYKHVRAHDSGVPIAAGERLFSRYDYREVVENQLLDIIQPDICHAGGITEIRKIANFVEPYHIRFAPHNPNGPVATAANLQVCVSAQNFDILEFSSGIFQLEELFSGISLRPTNGYFEVSDRPGFGIDLNVDAFESRPYKDTQYRARYKADGTVAEI